ncbi:MAG: MFS transporter [Acidobacteriaceae bacterium]|nr:MFS transporter [Acidobacteriaceae bacterium]
MPAESAERLRDYDEADVSKLHWKIMFVSGMGFFTDAYDLFIIGVAMAMIKAEWHPSAVETGLITSTALLASAVGAVVFGRIADLLGRKRIYGVEVLVLALGAIASALSPNIAWLIFFRIILGLGIGGDYPVSATIMSEFAGKRSRGMLISLVFAMQAAGLIFGPIFAAILLATNLNHDLVWRILLAFGAVPALAVFYWRRRIDETPRFKLALEKRKAQQAHAVCAEGDFWKGFTCVLKSPRLRIRLLGTSLAWFLMDFAYYGNTVSSPLVLGALAPHASLLKHTLTQLEVFAIAALPGYFVAAVLMDRLGRKSIQILGFTVMALCFGALAFIPNIDKYVLPFLLIYGLSYFFTEFGPNATTFVYPAEVFPAGTRTTGHGIAAAMGKIGGFVGVFLFPILMKAHGLPGAELAAAIVSALGIIVTAAMLPETKGKTLEELNEEATAAITTQAREMPPKAAAAGARS